MVKINTVNYLPGVNPHTPRAWGRLKGIAADGTTLGNTPTGVGKTWVGVALERMTAFALPQEQAASAVRSHNGTSL